jgi:hypothetical protein
MFDEKAQALYYRITEKGVEAVQGMVIGERDRKSVV